MSEARTTAAPDRFLLAIVGGAIALIVVGIAIVLLAGGRGATPAADPASPAGVVQSYIEALRAGDRERAQQHLSRSARRAQEQIKEGFPRFPDMGAEERRYLIEPLQVGETTADVKVTISTFSARSEPFSTSTWHREVRVRLVHQDGAWRIDEPAEPYGLIY